MRPTMHMHPTCFQSICDSRWVRYLTIAVAPAKGAPSLPVLRSHSPSPEVSCFAGKSEGAQER